MRNEYTTKKMPVYCALLEHGLQADMKVNNNCTSVASAAVCAQCAREFNPGLTLRPLVPDKISYTRGYNRFYSSNWVCKNIICYSQKTYVN